MQEFIINENDANQRLDKFMQKAVPLLPKSLMYKYLRTKRIKLNGKRAEISEKLKKGDVLSLYINDEFFENAEKSLHLLKLLPPDIIYEDENIILCNKEAGLPVHEDNSNSKDTLINRVIHYLYEKGEYSPDEERSFAPALCNRIDRNTTGIVVAAKNAEALRILNEKIKNREVHKYYLCAVAGKPKPASATLKAFLRRYENNSTVKVFSAPVPDGKTILTKYRTIKTSRKNALLEVELLTGRTHQIRAHMAFAGHPILGDGKYGIGNVNREYGLTRQLLCSYKLKFIWESDSGILDYLNGREFEIPKVDFAEDFLKKY